MIFAASIIDKITSLHTGIALPDDLGYIGELEGATHSVSPNDSVAGFPQLQQHLMHLAFYAVRRSNIEHVNGTLVRIELLF
jgi:hypothetical protein